MASLLTAQDINDIASLQENIMEEIATEIFIADVYVKCPYCGCVIGDLMDWPAGAKTECDECGKIFRVSTQPEIIRFEV
jgi:hypothetical protein